LEEALESIRGWETAEPPVRFFLAEAYVETGRLADAVAQWERLVRMHYEDTAAYSLWMATALYKLGLAYEQLGQRENAVKEYEMFLEIFKDADPDLEEVSDARNRLERLRSP
jgi:cytochrome c-type biogenesis protein CcmH/NrfG